MFYIFALSTVVVKIWISQHDVFSKMVYGCDTEKETKIEHSVVFTLIWSLSSSLRMGERVALSRCSKSKCCGYA